MDGRLRAPHSVPVPDRSKRWARWSVQLREIDDGAPLCLSLANTKHWRNSAAPRENLHGYADVVKWAVLRQIVTADQGAALECEAAAHSHAANAELRRTIALREAVAGLFAARAHGRAAPHEALAELLRSFNEASKRLKLGLAGTRLIPEMPGVHEGLEVPRWQAAFSAIGLVTSDAIDRVKQCADERGCGWLFVDTTRNRSRLFCFSSECGNRARQAKFRERQRASDPSPRR